MNVETIILRDAIPDNAKIIDSRFRDYRLRFNDEIIIHSSPSTGPFGLYENDVFYQFEKEPKPDQQIRQPNFVDPWIVIKSIPNAKIVNKNTIISQENMILIGLQYHYVTPLVKPENMSHVEIDHYLNSNSKPEIFVPVAKETENLSEVFFLGGTDNFGHWIFEFLPKLIWYKKYLFNLVFFEDPERSGRSNLMRYVNLKNEIDKIDDEDKYDPFSICRKYILKASGKNKNLVNVH